MKKLVLFLVLAALVAGGAFALPEFKLSAGAGGYFTSDFGGGVEASFGGMTLVSMKTPYFGGGGFAFVDVTIAELSVGFFGGGGTFITETLGNLTLKNNLSLMGLDISFLGKFPFAINENLSVFPLLGVTYRVMLSVKDEDGNAYQNSAGDDAPGDFSAMWYKLGGGVDYSFTYSIYLRVEALYGLRLASKFEKDLISSLGPIDTKTLLGHGFEAKLAVGFRF
ncbi:hypothetical protein FACS1894147_08560 [Spirochaetia bacterium]|nr:hypothetical protein FACS1894147_08560 [Spirochaetia bacterium]